LKRRSVAFKQTVTSGIVAATGTLEQRGRGFKGLLTARLWTLHFVRHGSSPGIDGGGAIQPIDVC
jgi:hypothetical protein